MKAMLTECVPCCDRKAALILKHLIWSVIRSESFLYGLHLLVFIFGSIKAILNLHTTSPTLELIQSIFETSATALLIAVRMGNSIEGFAEVKKTLRSVESASVEEESSNVHIQKMRSCFILSHFV